MRRGSWEIGKYEYIKCIFCTVRAGRGNYNNSYHSDMDALASMVAAQKIYPTLVMVFPGLF
jgi:hypothetical protein